MTKGEKKGRFALTFTDWNFKKGEKKVEIARIHFSVIEFQMNSSRCRGESFEDDGVPDVVRRDSAGSASRIAAPSSPLCFYSKYRD